MDNSFLSVGMILLTRDNSKRYRVIAIMADNIVLCEMDITKLNLLAYDSRVIINMMANNDFTVEQEDVVIFDANTLSDGIKKRYENKRNMMNVVVKEYGPSFLGLCGKKQRPALQAIMKKYSISGATFWRTCTQFLQSGMKDISLVDSKAFGMNKGKEYQYDSKPGPKSEYFDSKGVVVNKEIRQYFNEALNDYKKGRNKTLVAAFDRMNLLHFTRTEIVDGVKSLVLLPVSERPTKKQFYYYASKHLTEQEKDLIKTSAMEQRNNKRLIISDTLNGIVGPGDMVEIDACEADVSLVSAIDANQAIGRPIVYFMIDVFTRIILAVSVTFDNNSVLGITNLFLNLADNKHEYCRKYGMDYNNDMIWPSNIIPRRLRVDRGSEFKSKEFDRICLALGIEKQIVSGASGSLKGIVEQSFHQMHSKQNVHLENYGLIEKRYDCNHHKEATLNIEQYTKMIINFILTHNQEYDENYPITKDMIEKKIKPIPAVLWEYGVNKYGSPRPIAVMEQYLYDLMTPVKATLSRRGICFKSLWYLPTNDKALAKEMFNAGTKKIPFEVRMDMRDVSNVYYLRDGKMITAPLNELLNGNADYKGLTMKQYEDYRKGKGQLMAEGRVHNEELSAFNYAVNNAVVSEAKKTTVSDTKEIRPAREAEKQAVSHENKISKRIPKKKMIEEPIPTLPEETVEPIKDVEKKGEATKGKEAVSKYNNWDEALDDLWENF